MEVKVIFTELLGKLDERMKIVFTELTANWEYFNSFLDIQCSLNEKEEKLVKQINTGILGLKALTYSSIDEKIDVVVYYNDAKKTVKAGLGKPLNLYQLKMYWDGLVLNSKFPDYGMLLVEDYNDNLTLMVNQMNTLTPPNGSKPYNLKILKHPKEIL